jgi:hypothetical protein
MNAKQFVMPIQNVWHLIMELITVEMYHLFQLWIAHLKEVGLSGLMI